MGAPE